MINGRIQPLQEPESRSWKITCWRKKGSKSPGIRKEQEEKKLEATEKLEGRSTTQRKEGNNLGPLLSSRSSQGGDTGSPEARSAHRIGDPLGNDSGVCDLCEVQNQMEVLLQGDHFHTAGNSQRGIQTWASTISRVLGQVPFWEGADYLNLCLRTTIRQLHFRAPSITFPQCLGEKQSPETTVDKELARKRSLQSLNVGHEGHRPYSLQQEAGFELSSEKKECNQRPHS